MSNQGFSLAEILVAILLFSIFGMGFFINQSGNIANSNRMNELLLLHQLGKRKMNEVLIHPPEFSNALENDVEEKDFEEEPYKDYRYKIEFKKFELPNIQKLIEAANQGEEGAEEPNSQESSQTKNYLATIFQKIQETANRILWQVQVTITNKETKETYTLSSWIENKKEKVEIQL